MPLKSDDENWAPKSLRDLYEEGLISREKLHSILMLAKAGGFYSGTAQDAQYITEQLEKLDRGEEIGT